MLVEDSVDVLLLLQMELESLGYEVIPASDADTALAAARRCRPDIIVSDLRMPGTDGIQFIQQLRQIPGLASTPAIALTGATLEKDVQQALASGFSAHLVKPVEAVELDRRIRQFTALRLHRKAG
jgi:CheY-like chemotaxis protein